MYYKKKTGLYLLIIIYCFNIYYTDYTDYTDYKNKNKNKFSYFP